MTVKRIYDSRVERIINNLSPKYHKDIETISERLSAILDESEFVSAVYQALEAEGIKNEQTESLAFDLMIPLFL